MPAGCCCAAIAAAAAAGRPVAGTRGFGRAQQQVRSGCRQPGQAVSQPRLLLPLLLPPPLAGFLFTSNAPDNWIVRLAGHWPGSARPTRVRVVVVVVRVSRRAGAAAIFAAINIYPANRPARPPARPVSPSTTAIPGSANRAGQVRSGQVRLGRRGRQGQLSRARAQACQPPFARPPRPRPTCPGFRGPGQAPGSGPIARPPAFYFYLLRQGPPRAPARPYCPGRGQGTRPRPGPGWSPGQPPPPSGQSWHQAAGPPPPARRARAAAHQVPRPGIAPGTIHQWAGLTRSRP